MHVQHVVGRDRRVERHQDRVSDDLDEVAGVGLGDVVIVELDGHDGHRLGRATGTGKVHEVQPVTLGQQTDASGLVGLAACGATERGQLGPQPVGAIHVHPVYRGCAPAAAASAGCVPAMLPGTAAPPSGVELAHGTPEDHGAPARTDDTPQGAGHAPRL